MWHDWSDVHIIATDSDRKEITDAVCPWCGHKEKVDEAIKHEQGGVSDSTKIELDKIQKTAEWFKKYNNLWHRIESKDLDLYQALYEIAKLNQVYDKDVGHGYAGVSSVNSSRVAFSCHKCGQPVTFYVAAESKIENEMPNQIADSVWRSLKAPSREVLARTLDKLGGSVENVLESVRGDRFSDFRNFLAQTEENLQKLNLNSEDECGSEFRDFLKEFREWIDNKEKKAWNRYLQAIGNLAMEDVAYGR